MIPIKSFWNSHHEHNMEEQKGSDLLQRDFTVQAVRDTRNGEDGKEYLIKWVGFPEEENTWEKEKDLVTDGMMEQIKERLARIAGEEQKKNDQEERVNELRRRRARQTQKTGIGPLAQFLAEKAAGAASDTAGKVVDYGLAIGKFHAVLFQLLTEAASARTLKALKKGKKAVGKAVDDAGGSIGQVAEQYVDDAEKFAKKVTKAAPSTTLRKITDIANRQKTKNKTQSLMPFNMPFTNKFFQVRKTKVENLSAKESAEVTAKLGKIFIDACGALLEEKEKKEYEGDEEALEYRRQGETLRRVKEIVKCRNEIDKLSKARENAKKLMRDNQWDDAADQIARVSSMLADMYDDHMYGTYADQKYDTLLNSVVKLDPNANSDEDKESLRDALSQKFVKNEDGTNQLRDALRKLVEDRYAGMLKEKIGELRARAKTLGVENVEQFKGAKAKKALVDKIREKEGHKKTRFEWYRNNIEAKSAQEKKEKLEEVYLKLLNQLDKKKIMFRKLMKEFGEYIQSDPRIEARTDLNAKQVKDIANMIALTMIQVHDAENGERWTGDWDKVNEMEMVGENNLTRLDLTGWFTSFEKSNFMSQMDPDGWAKTIATFMTASVEAALDRLIFVPWLKAAATKVWRQGNFNMFLHFMEDAGSIGYALGLAGTPAAVLMKMTFGALNGFSKVTGTFTSIMEWVTEMFLGEVNPLLLQLKKGGKRGRFETLRKLGRKSLSISVWTAVQALLYKVSLWWFPYLVMLNPRTLRYGVQMYKTLAGAMVFGVRKFLIWAFWSNENRETSKQNMTQLKRQILIDKQLNTASQKELQKLLQVRARTASRGSNWCYRFIAPSAQDVGMLLGGGVAEVIIIGSLAQGVQLMKWGLDWIPGGVTRYTDFVQEQVPQNVNADAPYVEVCETGTATCYVYEVGGEFMGAEWFKYNSTRDREYMDKPRAVGAFNPNDGAGPKMAAPDRDGFFPGVFEHSAFHKYQTLIDYASAVGAKAAAIKGDYVNWTILKMEDTGSVIANFAEYTGVSYLNPNVWTSKFLKIITNIISGKGYPAFGVRQVRIGSLTKDRAEALMKRENMYEKHEASRNLRKANEELIKELGRQAKNTNAKGTNTRDALRERQGRLHELKEAVKLFKETAETAEKKVSNPEEVLFRKDLRKVGDEIKIAENVLKQTTKAIKAIQTQRIGVAKAGVLNTVSDILDEMGWQTKLEVFGVKVGDVSISRPSSTKEVLDKFNTMSFDQQRTMSEKLKAAFNKCMKEADLGVNNVEDVCTINKRAFGAQFYKAAEFKKQNNKGTYVDIAELVREFDLRVTQRRDFEDLMRTWKRTAPADENNLNKTSDAFKETLRASMGGIDFNEIWTKFKEMMPAWTFEMEYDVETGDLANATNATDMSPDQSSDPPPEDQEFTPKPPDEWWNPESPPDDMPLPQTPWVNPPPALPPPGPGPLGLPAPSAPPGLPAPLGGSGTMGLLPASIPPRPARLAAPPTAHKLGIRRIRRKYTYLKEK